MTGGGDLDVRALGDDRSEVEVRIHTERVTEDTDGSIQGGVDETLAAIKQLVERAGALDS